MCWIFSNFPTLASPWKMKRPTTNKYCVHSCKVALGNNMLFIEIHLWWNYSITPAALIINGLQFPTFPYHPEPPVKKKKTYVACLWNTKDHPIQKHDGHLGVVPFLRPPHARGGHAWHRAECRGVGQFPLGLLGPARWEVWINHRDRTLGWHAWNK